MWWQSLLDANQDWMSGKPRSLSQSAYLGGLGRGAGGGGEAEGAEGAEGAVGAEGAGEVEIQLFRTCAKE